MKGKTSKKSAKKQASTATPTSFDDIISASVSNIIPAKTATKQAATKSTKKGNK